MVRRAAVLAWLLLPLAACDDGLAQRPPTRPGTVAAALADPVPPGSVPRGALPAAAPAAPDPARGRDRFAIHCTPCHGAGGDGDGAVVRHGFPAPPSFHAPEKQSLTSARIVGVMTHGSGPMPAYGDRIAPADRWAIAAHIKALQAGRAGERR